MNENLFKWRTVIITVIIIKIIIKIIFIIITIKSIVIYITQWSISAYLKKVKNLTTVKNFFPSVFTLRLKLWHSPSIVIALVRFPN